MATDSSVAISCCGGKLFFFAYNQRLRCAFIVRKKAHSIFILWAFLQHITAINLLQLLHQQSTQGRQRLGEPFVREEQAAQEGLGLF